MRRLQRVVVVWILVVFITYNWINVAEPKPTPRTTTAPPPFVVVVSSVPRDDAVIQKSLASILRETSVPVHVWGYVPSSLRDHARITIHDSPNTPHHTAFYALRDKQVPRWVGDDKSHSAIRDNLQRSRWRSRIALDAWAILQECRDLFPDTPLVWIENDAVMRKGFQQNIRYPPANEFLSCYIHGSAKRGTYGGDGAVCIVFGPDFDSSVILGYHMVEPLDWILVRSDTRPMAAYSGTRHPRGHQSTRVL